MASQLTGWTTIDSFLLFFVYFWCGYRFSDRIFAFAHATERRPGSALTLLVLWAIIEEIAVTGGLPQIPGATAVFGLTGGLAVVALSALLQRARAVPWLAYWGRNSLVIYLSFFLPMAATRLLLLRTSFVHDIGWMSFIVATVAITAPLTLNAIVGGTPFALLYSRSAWARLRP